MNKLIICASLFLVINISGVLSQPSYSICDDPTPFVSSNQFFNTFLMPGEYRIEFMRPINFLTTFPVTCECDESMDLSQNFYYSTINLLSTINTNVVEDCYPHYWDNLGFDFDEISTELNFAAVNASPHSFVSGADAPKFLGVSPKDEFPPPEIIGCMSSGFDLENYFEQMNSVYLYTFGPDGTNGVYFRNMTANNMLNTHTFLMSTWWVIPIEGPIQNSNPGTIAIEEFDIVINTAALLENANGTMVNEGLFIDYYPVSNEDATYNAEYLFSHELMHAVGLAHVFEKSENRCDNRYPLMADRAHRDCSQGCANINTDACLHQTVRLSNDECAQHALQCLYAQENCDSGVGNIDVSLLIHRKRASNKLMWVVDEIDQNTITGFNIYKRVDSGIYESINDSLIKSVSENGNYSFNVPCENESLIENYYLEVIKGDIRKLIAFNE